MKVAVVTPRWHPASAAARKRCIAVWSTRCATPGTTRDEIAVPRTSRIRGGARVVRAVLRARSPRLRPGDLDQGARPTWCGTRVTSSYLLHTLRVFYDMFEAEYGAAPRSSRRSGARFTPSTRGGLQARPRAPSLRDRAHAVSPLFEASPWWQPIRFQALHRPPALSGFRRPARRTTSSCRAACTAGSASDLVIEAYKHLKRDVPLIITGTGEDERRFVPLAGGDPRIRFLGDVSDGSCSISYAEALLVPFVPDAGGLRAHHDRGVQEPQAGDHLHRFRRAARVRARRRTTATSSSPEPKAIARRVLRTPIDHRRARGADGARTGLGVVAHIAWEPIVARADRRRRIPPSLSRTKATRAPRSRRPAPRRHRPRHAAHRPGRRWRSAAAARAVSRARHRPAHHLRRHLRLAWRAVRDGITSAPTLEEIDVPLTVGTSRRRTNGRRAPAARR